MKGWGGEKRRRRGRIRYKIGMSSATCPSPRPQVKDSLSVRNYIQSKIMGMELQHMKVCYFPHTQSEIKVVVLYQWLKDVKSAVSAFLDIFLMVTIWLL